MIIEQFVKNYIDAWSTINSNERRKLIEMIYSSTAKFYAEEPEDPSIELNGIDAVFENITRVTERLVIGQGMKTELVNYLKNHNTIRVSWQMKTSAEEITLKGMNFLQIDSSNKIEKDYIFIGVKH